MGGDFTGKQQDSAKGIYALAGKSLFICVSVGFKTLHHGVFALRFDINRSLPLAANDVFTYLNHRKFSSLDLSAYVSFFEIYNGKVRMTTPPLRMMFTMTKISRLH